MMLEMEIEKVEMREKLDQPVILVENVAHTVVVRKEKDLLTMGEITHKIKYSCIIIYTCTCRLMPGGTGYSRSMQFTLLPEGGAQGK